MRHLKNSLLRWNKSYVGSLENRALFLANSISLLQRKEEQLALSAEDSRTLQDLLEKYARTSKQIKTKWAQKARSQWLINGDDNTKYFFPEAKIQRQRNLTSLIQSEQGTLISNPMVIMEKGISFFQKLWNSNYSVCFDEFPIIEPCVSYEENEALTAISLVDDIKRIVWAMPNFKSPRSYGFGPSFYRKAWKIIKDDLIFNI